MRQGRNFENTVEVGGAELKGGANVGQKIFDLYVYARKLYQVLAVIKECSSRFEDAEWTVIPFNGEALRRKVASAVRSVSECSPEMGRERGQLPDKLRTSQGSSLIQPNG